MRPGHFCPGNSGVRGSSGRPVRRFNEAGAFLPRKRSLNLLLVAPRSASMRPGHFCPGNYDNDAQVAGDSAQLQ